MTLRKGAFFSDFERTLTFSIVLSSLTAFPIGITFTDYDQLELLLFENRFVLEYIFNAILKDCFQC
jgi:hypothetical protein